MATGTDNQSCSSVASGDSHLKSKPNGFFDSFVFDYLSKRVEARELVKLKEDGGRFFLRFNDLNQTSLIYCDFKQKNGKILKRDERRRKDNLKNTLLMFEREGSLKKIAAGTDFEHGKEYFKYEVTNGELWRSLKRNYSLQRDPCKNHENFRMDYDETSSDTGLGAIGQSDDPFHYENDEDPVNNSISGTSSKIEGVCQPGVPLFDQRHWDCHTSRAETSSDTGLGMTQSDEQFHNQTHENFRESRGVLSSEPSSDTGDVSQIDLDRFVNETILGDVDVEKVAEGIANELDDSLFDQMNLSTSENGTTQRPPPLSTAGDEKIPELTIVPDYCSIEGGGQFIVRANQDLPEGTYKIQFDDYGICKARGSGSKHLDGSDNIPAARRRGTHFVMVQVFDVRGESIGGIPFEYRDNKVNRYRRELVKNSRSLSGSNPHNEPHQRKQKSSSNSMQYTGPSKKFKSGPVDMPMVMYFCDEMAKGGDEDFFSALKKLGILAEVLANRSEYYKDFAITAKEHGYNELAEMLAMSPRELPCDGDMETLTIGKLIDAVEQERSLANSDPVSSDSDDDSNSCSSGYNGDCDSEDLNDEEESLNDVVIQEAESPSDTSDLTQQYLAEARTYIKQNDVSGIEKFLSITGGSGTGKSAFINAIRGKMHTAQPRITHLIKNSHKVSDKYLWYPVPRKEDATLSENGLPLEQRKTAWNQLNNHLFSYQNTFLGFQMNQSFDSERIKPFLNIVLNNDGDPFSPSSQDAMNTKVMECAVLDYFAKLWRVQQSLRSNEAKRGYWGYVTVIGSSEGNILGLFNARDYLAGIPLLNPMLNLDGFKAPGRDVDPNEPMMEMHGHMLNEYVSSHDHRNEKLTHTPRKDKPSNFTPVVFFAEDCYQGFETALRVLQMKTFCDIGSGNFSCTLKYADDYPSSFSDEFLDQNGWPHAVPVEADGSISIPCLVKLVTAFVSRGFPPLVIFPSGTTFKGASDNPQVAINQLVPILKQHGMYERRVYSSKHPTESDIRNGFWFHIDGALGGAQLQLLKMAIDQDLVENMFRNGFSVFDFRIPEVKSIAMSLHEWFGFPVPSAVFMMRNKYQVRSINPPLYTGGLDSTLSGSRDGHSVLFMWDLLLKKSCDDFKEINNKSRRRNANGGFFTCNVTRAPRGTFFGQVGITHTVHRLFIPDNQEKTPSFVILVFKTFESENCGWHVRTKDSFSYLPNAACNQEFSSAVC